jgi:hypothetical protein
MILYDQICLSSTHYLDFLHLARRFGVAAVQRLLEEGILVPYLPTGCFGQAGHVGPLRASRGKEPLPKLHFDFVEVMSRDYDRVLADVFMKQEYLRATDKRTLRRVLDSKRRIRDSEVIRPTNDAWRRMIEEASPVVAEALSLTLLRRGCAAPRAEQIEFEGVFYDGDDLRIQTNLQKLIPGFSIDDDHEVIESALMMVRGATEVFAAASWLECIPSWSDESGFLEVARNEIRPEQRTHDELSARLEHVLAINDFPSLQTLYDDPEFRIEGLLQTRNCRECAEFRTWLRTVDRIDADELREASTSFSQKAFELRRSLAGKTLKLLWTAGEQVAGVVVPAAGLASAGISVAKAVREEFSKSCPLPQQGALAFLNKDLARLFGQSGSAPANTIPRTSQASNGRAKDSPRRAARHRRR